ncbi:MAG TPA: ATP-binding protein [Polyangiaceae bacterium]|nr:ATP-binding protein [Polyangiaceae bacterium]
MTRLVIHNFAHLAEVDLSFGDLTLIVGAQATGKSLTGQWLKFATDGGEVVSTLRDAGHRVDDRDTLLDLLFGSGMSTGWEEDTKVSLDGTRIDPLRLTYRGRKDRKPRVFFIPAHRAMLMSDGWAAPFQRLTPDTPVVARLFSQHLYQTFTTKRKSDLFPVTGKLKKQYRDAIAKAVFHGGSIGVEDDVARHARRIVLRHGETRIPYMAWTAGQREFTPLLLGLYNLLPSTRRSRAEPIEWVIIEEPEMGLHPRALNVVIMLVLDLLWRGYRVVITTHSPDVVAAAWMFQQLKEAQASWKAVLEGIGLPKHNTLREVGEAALAATCKTHHLFFDSDGRVRSQDISSLDVGSDDLREAAWGGLTEFTTGYAEAVAKAVARSEAP